MDKTVIQLFAGVGGFRVGLNNITSIDDKGHAIENGNFEFVRKPIGTFNKNSTRFCLL